MKIYKPPTKPELKGRKSIFLAGTIDNGNSEDWQAKVQDVLSDLDIVVLNPRRDKWNPNWEQSIKNPLFKEQVEWELDGLDQVSVILMYFASGSKSPISLLELGLYATSGKLMVCCEEKFWRKGNVEIVCERYGIPLFEELDQALFSLRKHLT